MGFFTVTIEQQGRLNETVPALGPRGTCSAIRMWLRQLRVHQWAKNVLVFLPMVGAQDATSIQAWRAGGLAFLALSLAASAVNILNDLLDVASD